MNVHGTVNENGTAQHRRGPRTLIAGIVGTVVLSFMAGTAVRGEVTPVPTAKSADTAVTLTDPKPAEPRIVAKDEVNDFEPGDKVRFSPSQRELLRSLTNTAAKRAAFEENLEKGLEAFGMKVEKRGTGPKGIAKSNTTVVTNAAYTSTGNTASTAFDGSFDGDIVDIFAQGWSRDHWWLTASYADFAYGGTAIATGACSVYLPWFVCIPLGGIIASWIRGYGRAHNHGVWFSVYRSGYITGGRW